MTFESCNYEYTDLEVWKEARILVKIVYDITKHFPEVRIWFYLANPRTVVSIPSNVAEGCGYYVTLLPK